MTLIRERLRTYTFWRDFAVISLLLLAVVLLLSLMIPAPYNTRYAFNRIFKNRRTYAKTESIALQKRAEERVQDTVALRGPCPEIVN